MKLINVVAAVVYVEMIAGFSKALRSGFDKQLLWVRKSILSSTKGLARAGVASAAVGEVMAMINLAKMFLLKHIFATFFV